MEETWTGLTATFARQDAISTLRSSQPGDTIDRKHMDTINRKHMDTIFIVLVQRPGSPAKMAQLFFVMCIRLLDLLISSLRFLNQLIILFVLRKLSRF